MSQIGAGSLPRAAKSKPSFGKYKNINIKPAVKSGWLWVLAGLAAKYKVFSGNRFEPFSILHSI